MWQGVAPCLYLGLRECKCERVVSIIIMETKGQAKNIKQKIYLNGKQKKGKMLGLVL